MTRGPLVAVAVLSATLGSLGCKDPDPETGAGGSGGGSTSNSATTSGSGGSGGATSGPKKLGAVSVLQQLAGATWTGVVSPVFYEAEGAPIACTKSTAGDCEILDCTFDDPSGNTPVTHRSAGVVTVGGTTQPFSISPAADSTYAAATTMTQLWTEGATIDFAASGDVVPAFSGSVVGVASLTLTSPSLASGSITVDRTKDLAVTWTGGAAGTATAMLTRLEQVGAASHSVTVACTWAPSAATGTVPAAALQAIPAGPMGSFSFFDRDDDVIGVSGWSITLSALTSNVAAAATFQ
jgi:hypothetical protein